MAEIVTVRMDWDRTAIPLRLAGFFTVHYGPEPGWPFGRRGLAMAGAWAQLSTPGCAGMLVLDGDVAADPADIAAVKASVHDAPDLVHVAPVRLWPASTGQAGWVWAHGTGGYSRDDPDEPDVWTFSLTYLPRRLLEAAVKTGLARWTYPSVDKRMHGLAGELGITARTVRGAAPTHLHWLG